MTAAGVKTFVREEGRGPTVLCLHGVPASSFLYRKVLPALASRGLRGVAYDLPGLGWADRGPHLDLTWSGLAAWSSALVRQLDLGPVHLVVHDVGGPVGLLLAGLLGDRVASLTVLNTPADPTRFTPPPPMRPLTGHRLARPYLAAMIEPLFVRTMRAIGIADQRSVSDAELAAYRVQLLDQDGGASFLRMMGSFEKDATTAARMRDGARAVRHRQVVWGSKDPALSRRRYGKIAQEVVDVPTVHELPGRHFLQEDCAPGIAEHVSRLVTTAGG